MSTKAVIFDKTVAFLREHLPQNWEIFTECAAAHRLSIAGMGIQTYELFVESNTRPQFIKALPDMAKSKLPILLLANYCSRKSKELLKQYNIAFCDITGNAWVPSMGLETHGAIQDPEKVDSRRMSFRGPKFSRLIQLLIDFSGTWHLETIYEIMVTDRKTVAANLKYLADRKLVEINDNACQADWPELLKAWGYECIPPRRAVCNGIYPVDCATSVDVLIHRLSNSPYPVLLSGAAIASKLLELPSSKTDPLYIWTQHITAVHEWCGLAYLRQEKATGPRIYVATPRDSAIFRRTTYPYSMLYGDLAATQPEIATRLLEWMQKNETQWRVPNSGYTQPSIYPSQIPYQRSQPSQGTLPAPILEPWGAADIQ